MTVIEETHEDQDAPRTFYLRLEFQHNLFVFLHLLFT